jgi:hypothetical protein
MERRNRKCPIEQNASVETLTDARPLSGLRDSGRAAVSVSARASWELQFVFIRLHTIPMRIAFMPVATRLPEIHVLLHQLPSHYTSVPYSVEGRAAAE